MRRAAFIFSALLYSVALATPALAQASKAPAGAPPPPPPVSEEVMKARMKPPVKGTASVDYMQSPTKTVKDELITVIKVKNTSAAPIVGFRIDQDRYRGKEEVSAGTGRLRSPIAPGEITELTLAAPVKPSISGSQMRFSHANGAVQPKLVKKFDGAPDAKPAAAPAKKK